VAAERPGRQNRQWGQNGQGQNRQWGQGQNRQWTQQNSQGQNRWWGQNGQPQWQQNGQGQNGQGQNRQWGQGQNRQWTQQNGQGQNRQGQNRWWGQNGQPQWQHNGQGQYGQNWQQWGWQGGQQQWRRHQYDWSSYHPGRRPPEWDRYRRGFDPRPYQWNRMSERHYRWEPYIEPPGWYYQRWAYGEILPDIFWSQQYWLPNYAEFGLLDPPYGYVWVRYGNDALLVDVESGQILSVEYGIFYA
jgi:Ni/Co efflux regulator RcnB